jgi:hypothetical protein
VSRVSEEQAVALVEVAAVMREVGARLLAADACDRVGRGMLRWAWRCEALAGRAGRRLRLVDGEERQVG